MSRKTRLQTAREQKDKRMKLVAIGGVVLLAAVLAFEVPKVMKSGGSGSSSPPAATTTSTTAASTPTGTPATAAAPTTATKLTNSDVAPRRSKSQLYSFSHFAGKDPFAQQLSATSALPTPPASTAAAAPASTGTATASASTAPPQQSPPAQQTSAAPQTSARTLAQTGAVTISVNGKSQSVQVGAKFPSANPLFKLVSVAHGVARIAIAGGSYASGAQTVSLTTGKPLTLVDTADGVHYELRLVSAS